MIFASSAWVIKSYGNVDMVAGTLRSIAILSGEKGLVLSIFSLMSVFALVLTIAKVFFKHNPGELFKSFAQVAIIPPLILACPTTVLIEDALVKGAPQQETVSNVPILLAVTASGLTRLGAAFTEYFEKNLHHVDPRGQSNYSLTGKIWGADILLDSQRYIIKDKYVEKNIQEIGRACVRNGLALQHFTVDELRVQGDILEYLSSRLTRCLTVPIYTEGGSREFVKCSDAIDIVRAQLCDQADHCILNNTILGSVGGVFGALNRMSADSVNIIAQHMAINTLRCGVNGESWALQRAVDQQNATYSITAQLSPRNVIAFRALMECIAYLLFVIMVFLAVLPNGIKRLAEWVKFFAWLQLIPVTFVIVAYFYEYPGPSSLVNGLTIESLEHMKAWYEDIRLQAGFMMAFTPMITYMLFFGSISQIVHMASSLISPAQSAAAVAATELTTGNYSYGNTSLEGQSYGNRSVNQMQLASSLSSGFYSTNTGVWSEAQSVEGNISTQSMSRFATNINGISSCGYQLNSAEEYSKQEVNSYEQRLADSTSNEMRIGENYIKSYAESHSHNAGTQTSEGADCQQAARSMMSYAENFAKSNNCSSSEALNMACSVGTGAGPGLFLKLFGVSADGSYRTGSEVSDLYNEAKQVAESKEFSEAYNKVLSYAQTEAESRSEEESVRQAKEWTESHSQSQSLSDSLSTALSESARISKMKNYYQTHQGSIDQNWNNDFQEWAIDELGGSIQFRNAMNDSSIAQELAKEFFQCQEAAFCEKYAIDDPITRMSVDPGSANYSSVDTSRIDSSRVDMNFQIPQEMENRQERSPIASIDQSRKEMIEQGHAAIRSNVENNKAQLKEECTDGREGNTTHKFQLAKSNPVEFVSNIIPNK